MNKQLCWYNIILIPLVHLLGVVGIIYAALWHFSLPTIILALAYFHLCGFAITGGYHRLFSHRSYEASWPVRFFLLMFGAASAQGSVFQWVSTHVQHHASDSNPNIEDPHDIHKGAWYAHMGWLIYEMPTIDDRYIKHLKKDRLACWQTKYYGSIMVFWGFILPGLIGLLWDDALGALLLAGFTRTTLQWHVTWCINSIAHLYGDNTFNRPDDSRNNYVLAAFLLALGEMYHSFHHNFPGDYRNGWKKWHIDPTKWAIIGLNKLKLVKNLHRTSDERIQRAIEKAQSSHV